jgi:hypothetical protein
MTPGQRAESLIANFGISSPVEIDIEAIAFASGVEVQYDDLTGCDATLVGVGNRAIATVRPSRVRGRERFSIGHELGHWEMHRGRSFRCRSDGPDENLASNRTDEKEADNFAAHILMPAALFNPRVNALVKPGFSALEGIAREFETSLLATSVRLADVNQLPVALACYSASGRRWYKSSSDIPRRWRLEKKLDEESFAFDLLKSGTLPAGLRKQPAEVWFENSDADDFEVYEDCVPGKDGEVLVLLYLETDMMEAEFDRNARDQGR